MDEEFQFLDERILYINPSELSLYKKLEKIAEENNKKDPKLLIIKTAQDALSVIVESEVLVAIRGIEKRSISLPFPFDVLNANISSFSLDKFLREDETRDYENEQIGLNKKQFNELKETIDLYGKALKKRFGAQEYNDDLSDLKDIFEFGMRVLYGFIYLAWHEYSISRIIPKKGSVEGNLESAVLLNQLISEAKQVREMLSGPVKPVNRIYKYQ